jgi:plasmid stabilization system protein ParE
MNPRFILAPEAIRDLARIWRYLRREASVRTADRVETAIREKFVYLARFPHAGHWRHDLTAAPVRFLSVYSYLIVYLPDTTPLRIVAILHGNRDVAGILAGRN